MIRLKKHMTSFLLASLMIIIHSNRNSIIISFFIQSRAVFTWVGLSLLLWFSQTIIFSSSSCLVFSSSAVAIRDRFPRLHHCTPQFFLEIFQLLPRAFFFLKNALKKTCHAISSSVSKNIHLLPSKVFFLLSSALQE